MDKMKSISEELVQIAKKKYLSIPNQLGRLSRLSITSWTDNDFSLTLVISKGHQETRLLWHKDRFIASEMISKVIRGKERERIGTKHKRIRGISLDNCKLNEEKVKKIKSVAIELVKLARKKYSTIPSKLWFLCMDFWVDDNFELTLKHGGDYKEVRLMWEKNKFYVSENKTKRIKPIK